VDFTNLYESAGQNVAKGNEGAGVRPPRETILELRERTGLRTLSALKRLNAIVGADVALMSCCED
jgi:hypothetical protein